MKKILLSIVALSTSINLFAQNMNQKIVYPTSLKTNTIHEYFGKIVQDPYVWLENDTAKNTEEWVKSQNKFTQDYLAKIPYRNQIKKRLTEVWNYAKESAPQKHGEYYTYYKNDGLQNQSVLYIKKGLNGKEEVLLDPNKLSKDGTVALQAAAFSKNEKYFAYAVSASGSDWQEIYVMDLATKKLTKDKIEHVKFTELAWLGDEGFFYAGYDKPKNEATKYSAKTEYQKIFFHKIGSASDKDILVYEDKAHPLRYVFPEVTDGGKYLVLNISEGTDGSEIKVRPLGTTFENSPKTDFTTIVLGFNTNAAVVGEDKGKLLLWTNQDAPNYKIVKVDAQRPSMDQWETLIPEQKNYLQKLTSVGDALFGHYLQDACTNIIQYDYNGKEIRSIQLPGLGYINGFEGEKEDSEVYYTYTSFTEPGTTYHYNIKTGESTLYRKTKVNFDTNAYETKQVFFPSKDGTMVPMFITAKKGIKLDGQNPTLVYGYGGFNISLTPSFSVANIPFLEQGGIYVLVTLRGGGEYGEGWHRSGMLENKQTVFDDFIAASEYLVEQKYTNSTKLAIRGGSNGGLLVGACMTQRPDLFAVAFPQVGVLDMLRYHKFTVGWGWAVEYGTSDKKDQFDYLIKYSPLHNIKPNVCYPATMVTTADHDDRVVPAHSFKFTARLQEFQSCDKPTLIRIDSKAGHGAGKPTSKLIDEAADIWSFLFYNMGYKAIK